MESRERSRCGAQRVPLYDILRVTAILFVVLCHCSEYVYLPLNSLPYSVLHFLGRLGVPLFFFLTGALVLSKKFVSPQSVKRFYSHNLIGLVVTAEVWIVIYCLWLNVRGGQVTIEAYIKYALFLENVPLTHWWYIPAILSIYVIAPLIALGVQVLCRERSLLLPIIGFSLLLNFVVPTFNRFAPLLNQPALYFQLTGVLGSYPTCILVGFLILHEKALSCIDTTLLVLLGIGCSFGAIIEGWLTAALWYDSIFLLGTSSVIAELFRRTINGQFSKRTQGFLTLLSSCSFGVYLVHLPVLDLIGPHIAISSHSGRTAILFLAASISSFGLAFLIRLVTERVPRLRSALLNS